MDDEPFRFLPDAEYEALGAQEKSEYLAHAIAAHEFLSKRIARRISELGAEFKGLA
jgi:hypothetical protein